MLASADSVRRLVLPHKSISQLPVAIASQVVDGFEKEIGVAVAEVADRAEVLYRVRLYIPS